MLQLMVGAEYRLLDFHTTFLDRSLEFHSSCGRGYRRLPSHCFRYPASCAWSNLLALFWQLCTSTNIHSYARPQTILQMLSAALADTLTLFHFCSQQDLLKPQLPLQPLPLLIVKSAAALVCGVCVCVCVCVWCVGISYAALTQVSCTHMYFSTSELKLVCVCVFVCVCVCVPHTLPWHKCHALTCISLLLGWNWCVSAPHTIPWHKYNALT